MNCSSCQQEQEYKRLVTLLPFTQTDWSSVPSLAASIRYIALGRARRWTTSVRQRGCGSLRLFGDGSLTFHGNVMLLPPLEWRKVSHRSPERDLTSKERIGNSVSDSLQCVGLRYVSASDSVAEGLPTWLWIQMLDYRALFFLLPWKAYQCFITMSNGASTTGWGNQALPQSCRSIKEEVLQSARGKVITISL